MNEEFDVVVYHQNRATSFTYIQTATEQIGTEWTRALPSSTLQGSTTISQDATAWLAAHLNEVTAKHAGQWVLIHNGGVLAASKDPRKLEKRAARGGIENPLIAEISKEPAVWNTAYAPQVL
jgi:hypothetical protein